jgi:hypothetical protein
VYSPSTATSCAHCTLLTRANGTRYFIAACAGTVPAGPDRAPRAIERLEQPLPPRHPARRATQLARQLLQRLDLTDRPRRRDRRVALQPVQRLDPQVAVDQHQPIGVADVSVRSNAPIAGSVRGPAGLDDGRTSLDAKYGTS